MKVAVLLSGGVNSSAALCQLAQQPGVELRAYYLKIWLEDDLAHMGICPWEGDLYYARAVCAHHPTLTILNIAHTSDGEKRSATLGMIAGNVYTAIWTLRNKSIRLISVRRARPNEKEVFKNKII